MSNEIRVGVISDTHGLLRPEACDAMRGCNLIIHAGDVGNPAVLDELRALAPTFAVRGNVDAGSWADALPLTQSVQVGSRSLWVLHDIAMFDPAAAAGHAGVIFGHSHKVLVEVRDDVLFLNPGAAGPRRFNLPVTVARLRVRGGAITPEIIELSA